MKFSAEQVAATMLNKIKNMLEKTGLNPKDMVISVPSYWTDQERKSLLDAAKIAEINVLRLFNECAASNILIILL